MLCFTKTVSTPLWSNQRDNSPPTDRWSCVVCVCMSAYTSVRFLACGGKGIEVWGGRGGGEEWGEVSRGTAGETPTSTSCCLKRARQQPACLPVCLHVPASLLLFLSYQPPPNSPSVVSPSRLSPAVPSFLLFSLATMHPDPHKKNPSYICRTSMHALECKLIHMSTSKLHLVHTVIQ